MSRKSGTSRMPHEQPPEIEHDPREVREQPEVEPPTRREPEVDERSIVREEPEMPEPNGPREKPEVDERPARKKGGAPRGPSTDVGGPRGIERGVGIETGDEVGGDVEPRQESSPRRSRTGARPARGRE